MAEQLDLTQQILQNIQQGMADIRNEVTAVRSEMRDGFLNLNVRMTSIEQKLDGIGTSQTGQSDRLDNLEQRIQILERRLALADEQ
jgi:predicted  nucleic acid-binding Zn-ribbon protein